MATKTNVTGMKPVEALSGTVQGTRFKVVLDDIHIEDIWDASVLPILTKDGIGKAILHEGTTAFCFRTSDKATIAFTADAGKLKVSAFYIEGAEEKQA